MNPFSKSICWLIPVGVMLAIEGGVQGWRHSAFEASEDPIFNWRGSELVSTAPAPFGEALKIYHADRGSEKKWPLADGRSINLFYFEWDEMETGPFADIGGHDAEVCNVAAGYHMVRTGSLRTYVPPGQKPLVFRTTVLSEPSGKIIYVFKLPWIQGVGEWHVNSSSDRWLRFKRSFIRHRGQARVVEAGVFGAESEEEAWQIVIKEVLNPLEWSDAK